LDEIIPRIDKVKERLDKVSQIIKCFRKSVLTAAVTGKLTRDWQMEHISQWDKTCLDEQTDYITSGSRGWAKYYSKTGAIFVRVQNIKKDTLILDKDITLLQRKTAFKIEFGFCYAWLRLYTMG